jgi:hypothetical protein
VGGVCLVGSVALATAAIFSFLPVGASIAGGAFLGVGGIVYGKLRHERDSRDESGEEGKSRVTHKTSAEEILYKLKSNAKLVEQIKKLAQKITKRPESDFIDFGLDVEYISNKLAFKKYDFDYINECRKKKTSPEGWNLNEEEVNTLTYAFVYDILNRNVAVKKKCQRRIGIIGPLSSGKTTICKKFMADSGKHFNEVRHNSNVKIFYSEDKTIEILDFKGCNHVDEVYLHNVKYLLDTLDICYLIVDHTLYNAESVTSLIQYVIKTIGVEKLRIVFNKCDEAISSGVDDDLTVEEFQKSVYERLAFLQVQNEMDLRGIVSFSAIKGNAMYKVQSHQNVCQVRIKEFSYYLEQKCQNHVKSAAFYFDVNRMRKVSFRSLRTHNRNLAGFEGDGRP